MIREIKHRPGQDTYLYDNTILYLFVLIYSSAKKDFCKLKVENGEETRVYTGQANITITGKACLAWTNITHEYGDYVGAEDFNYCRNPGKSQEREWCFFSSTEFEDCGVRTCGRKYNQ